jgi:MFS family permease
MTFGMYALLFVVPLYFQTVRGSSPFIAGLELLPMSVSFVVVSQLAGFFINRLGPRVVMTVGMACMGLGALALAAISFSPRDRRERTAASCPSVCEKTV